MKYDFKFLKVLMNVVILGLLCNNLICFSSSAFIVFSNVLIKIEKDAKNYQVSHFTSLFVSRSRMFTSTDTSEVSNLTYNQQILTLIYYTLPHLFSKSSEEFVIWSSTSWKEHFYNFHCLFRTSFKN